MIATRGHTRTGDFECNRCGGKVHKLAFRSGICAKGDYDLCYGCKQKPYQCRDSSHSLRDPYGQVGIPVEIASARIERYVSWRIGSKLGDSNPVLVDNRIKAVFDISHTTPFEELCQSEPDFPEHIVAEVIRKSRQFLPICKTSMVAWQYGQENIMHLLESSHHPYQPVMTLDENH